MSPIFTKNLLAFVKGGDLSLARSYAAAHPTFVAALRPYEVKLVNNACKAWGCPPVI